MPRGVYDRSAVKNEKSEKIEKPVKAAAKATKTRKVSAKAKTAAPELTGLETVPHIDLTVAMTKFHIVAANLDTLTHVAQMLSGLKNEDASNAVCEEIVRHVSVLASLRRTCFGLTDAEVLEETETAQAAMPANGSSVMVPMPSKPILPIPPGHSA